MSLLYMTKVLENPEMSKDEIIADLTDIDFGPSMTKQSFKDSTDINKILQKAQKAGTIDHLSQFGARYGDFAGYDLMEHMAKMNEANVIFAALPSEVRNEFNNEPGAFFEYVNHPDNVDRLHELLPAIAEPGSYDLDMSGKTPPGATKDPNVEGTKEPVKESVTEPVPDPE